MDKEQNEITEILLNAALEMIYLLTGEDYTAVKKTSGDSVTPIIHLQESGGWSQTPGPITEPPPHLLTNKEKILELTKKMTELLTGEVPIRCQDVTVYFSMEEWEYIGGHRDLYKDVMMEDHQLFTSLDGLMEINPPEKCPRRLYSLDYPEEKLSVPENQQLLYPDEDLPNINATERNVRGDQRCKEEIPADNCTRSSEGYLISSKDGGISLDTYEEQVIIPDLPSALHCTDLPSDPLTQRLSSDSSQPDKQEKSHRKDVQYQSTHTGEKPYSCSVCGKRFPYKSNLIIHERIHTQKKQYSCTECGKCFPHKSQFVIHERIHTREKLYSCSECGKCFTQKSDLVKHERSHTGEKPYSCLECEKCFTQRAHLVIHQRSHTGEKPYSCSECGKGFTQRAHLGRHQRVHTGEKPYSCSECGKCFKAKSNLVQHNKLHTGEKPYSCSECGKCFTHKSNFHRHEKSHIERNVC